MIILFDVNGVFKLTFIFFLLPHGTSKNKWVFGVDKGTSKAIAIDEKTSYDDFVHMVIKEYKVKEQIYDVKLSYMFPKKVLLTLTQNTPPVDIKNQRQFTGFLEQLKTEAMQVCLDIG